LTRLRHFFWHGIALLRQGLHVTRTWRCVICGGAFSMACRGRHVTLLLCCCAVVVVVAAAAAVVVVVTGVAGVVAVAERCWRSRCCCCCCGCCGCWLLLWSLSLLLLAFLSLLLMWLSMLFVSCTNSAQCEMLQKGNLVENPACLVVVFCGC
jgi:hypothetical protein